jgi:hypothetical protein
LARSSLTNALTTHTLTGSATHALGHSRSKPTSDELILEVEAVVLEPESVTGHQRLIVPIRALSIEWVDLVLERLEVRLRLDLRAHDTEVVDYRAARAEEIEIRADGLLTHTSYPSAADHGRTTIADHGLCPAWGCGKQSQSEHNNSQYGYSVLASHCIAAFLRVDASDVNRERSPSSTHGIPPSPLPPFGPNAWTTPAPNKVTPNSRSIGAIARPSFVSNVVNG